MFEGPETFIIENDSIKRSDINGEKKFVLAFRSVMIVGYKTILKQRIQLCVVLSL